MSTARFYTADDLDGMEKDTLAKIAEARGLEVVGTGADGDILGEDLIAAISADQDATGINPALAPLPAPADTPKTYRVTGTARVYDTAPGAEFAAAIPADRERMLIEGGAIAVVTPASPPASAKAAAPRTAATTRPKETK